MFEFACQVKAACGAAVVILYILPRVEGLRGMTPEDFDILKCAANARITSMCAEPGSQGIFFYRQMGFCDSEQKGGKEKKPKVVWLWDGIHPNKTEGWQLYKRSISNAMRMVAKVGY